MNQNADPLPTICHGIDVSKENLNTVDVAIEEIVRTLNKVPPDLVLRVICSVVMSFCCAQDDPVGIFNIIGYNVGAGIRAVIIKRVGNA